MEEGSTQNSGPHQFADKAPSPARKDRAGVVRTARAIVRLARARAENVNGLLITLRVTNSKQLLLPTRRYTTKFDLTVPEPMEFGYESEVGQHALAFSCQDTDGRVMELVMMRDGGGFDLLGGL